jgi:hypothetical protein
VGTLRRIAPDVGDVTRVGPPSRNPNDAARENGELFSLPARVMSWMTYSPP